MTIPKWPLIGAVVLVAGCSRIGPPADDPYRGMDVARYDPKFAVDWPGSAR